MRTAARWRAPAPTGQERAGGGETSALPFEWGFPESDSLANGRRSAIGILPVLVLTAAANLEPESAAVLLLADRQLRRNDVVSPHPSGRADGKARLGAGGEILRRLVVAPQVSRLCRRQISLGQISLLP